MKIRSGMILMVAAVALGGCTGATAGAGPAAGPTSTSGRTYPPGTRPTESKFTTAAKAALITNNFQAALDQARQGIAADTVNPQHYFLAGQAQVGLGNIEAADSMFDIAERKYPAYVEETLEHRERAWQQALSKGAEAYNNNNMAEAIQQWQIANRISDLHPESYLYLGQALLQEDRADEAVEAFRGGLAALQRNPPVEVWNEEYKAQRLTARPDLIEQLGQTLEFRQRFADAEQLYRQELAADSTNVALRARLAASIGAQQGRAAEAQAMYSQLLSQPGLGARDLESIGAALYNAEKYAEAATAFKRVTDLRPNSAQAWTNYSLALNNAKQWQQLATAAERLAQVDPLSQDAYIFAARAYTSLKQNAKATATVKRVEALPVLVRNVKLQAGASKATLRGEVVGNRARSGTPVALRFTFYGEQGPLGTQTVTVNAPARDAAAPFETSLDITSPVTGYSYELVP